MGVLSISYFGDENRHGFKPGVMRRLDEETEKIGNFKFIVTTSETLITKQKSWQR